MVRFRPYHRSRHVILHQYVKFYPSRTTLGRKNDVMSIFKILHFRGPIIGSLKRPRTTSSMATIPLNCLAFVFWRQTEKKTDEQMDKPVALSRSRCRERRLNKYDDEYDDLSFFVVCVSCFMNHKARYTLATCCRIHVSGVYLLSCYMYLVSCYTKSCIWRHVERFGYMLPKVEHVQLLATCSMLQTDTATCIRSVYAL